MASTLIVPTTHVTRVIQEDDRVVVIQDGKKILDMPHSAALVIAAEIRRVALRAEGQAKAPQIARDVGLLTRVGAPFGLSDDPRIKDEARNLAAWDPQLRKVRATEHPREVMGTPTVVCSNCLSGTCEVPEHRR